MATRSIEFDLEVDPVEFELDYSYYRDPGCYSGPPENCYPADECGEITLPKGWEDLVVQHFAEAAKAAIKSIEGRCSDWATDGTVAGWAEEDHQDYIDAMAEGDF